MMGMLKMKKYDKAKILKTTFMFIIVLFFIINILLPITTLFIKSFYIHGTFIGFGNFKTVIKNDGLLQAFGNSITVSSIVTIITIFIAFLFAYGIERTNIKGKKFFEVSAILPLFAPTMTYGIALIYIFGSKGILTTGFFGYLNNLKLTFNIYGKLGIIIAEILYTFPAVYLMILAGFKTIDYSLYEVADIMEVSLFRRFYTITLPNIKNNIINAFFTAFIMCFTDFGIPKIIGGNYDVLALKFYQYVIGQNQFEMGAVIAVLLLIPSLLYFIIYNYIIKNTYDNKNIRSYKIKKNIVRDIFFYVYNIIISFNIILVFVILFFASVIKNWPYDLSITLKYYNVKSVGISLLNVYKNTILIAFTTALIGTIVVFITAYIVERYKNFSTLRNSLRIMALLPLSVPGMVIGLSYILFFNKSWNVFNFLYGTFFVLILANIIHFFSVPFFTISEHLKKMDKNFEEVSECMGIPWYITLVKVILPISKFPIIKSFEYYFINSMVTISAVSFLYTSKTKIASIEILNKSDSGDIATSAAIAITIVIINLVIKFIFNKARKSEIYKG